MNTVKELSSYVYDDVKTENGMRIPKDQNNHLCDALRYAFYDVRFFHPEVSVGKKKYTPPIIAAKDINKGWDI